MALLEGGEAIELLFFEHSDSLEVALNFFTLLVRFAYFIVVGSHAGYVIENFSALVCRHFRKTGDVSLEHDVVSVWSGICCTKKAVKHFLGAFFSVQFVSGDGIV